MSCFTFIDIGSKICRAMPGVTGRIDSAWRVAPGAPPWLTQGGGRRFSGCGDGVELDGGRTNL
ncbi:MAG: hypothetical protein DIU71_16065, partial [Proteobacteria bacterium]